MHRYYFLLLYFYHLPSPYRLFLFLFLTAIAATTMPIRPISTYMSSFVSTPVFTVGASELLPFCVAKPPFDDEPPLGFPFSFCSVSFVILFINSHSADFSLLPFVKTTVSAFNFPSSPSVTKTSA